MSVRPEFKEALRLLSKVSSPVIVEVGAHKGDGVALYFEQCSNPTVYAVEPDPANFKLLVDSFGGAKLYEYAISDSDDTVTVYSNDRRSNIYTGGKKEDCIPSKTMSTFMYENILEPVDFVRFDCYGAEYKIFDGPLDWLKRVDILLITMHNKESGVFSKMKSKRKEIVDKLKSYKFEMIFGCPLKGHKHIHQLWRKK